MKAIILAGGEGTRLAPYTTVFPKPLVPIGHRPILDIIVKQLEHYGFKDIVLCVGYLSELIRAYFLTANSRFSNVNISFINEKKPLGTVGSLGLVPDLNETFLVMNGDILTSVDYSKLVECHKEKGATLTIGMCKKNVKIDLGVLEHDQDNFITDYHEKPEKNYMVSMGIYVYDPKVLKYIEPDTPFDLPNLVLKLIKNNEPVVGCPCYGNWLDIGRNEDYVLAQEQFEKEKSLYLPWEKEE